MKKILYLINSLSFFVSHRLPIAQAAAARGFEVHIAAPLGQGVDRITEEKFIFHTIDFSRKGMNPLREGFIFAKILDLYRSVKPDIVHMVTIKPIVYGGIAARISRVPACIYAISGLGYLYIGGGRAKMLYRKLANLLYRAALAHHNSLTIFQNEDDRALFVDANIVAKNKTALIKGSGVALNVFSPLPEPSGEVVMLASRMLLDKGVREFIGAAMRLKLTHPKVKFVLVGSVDRGNPASLNASQIQEWIHKKYVEWWGERTDMPVVLNAATIVCLPSYREGLPKVLIEAAACGRALVATDVPGCREAVRAGVNGLLVPARDTESLAEAIQRLLDNKLLRQKFATASRRLAEEEFDINAVVEKTHRLYDQVLIPEITKATL